MNNIKKSLICALFAFLVALASTRVFADDATAATPSLSRTAYSRIAPYVSPTTFLVVRVDFSAFDPDAFGQTIDDLFVGALQERGIDRYSVNASNREFRKTLEIFKEDFKPIKDALASLGLREAFVVAQSQDAFEQARLIIPVASSKREALKAALSLTLAASKPDIFELKGALCVVDDRDADKKIYEKFQPNPHEKLKRLFETTPGAFLQVYCSNLRIGKALESGSQELKSVVADLPEETRKGISEFDEYFRDAQFAFNLNEASLSFEASFTTAEHTENVRVGIERLADYCAEKISARFETSDEKHNLNALQRELIRGALKALAPQRQGATLVFKADSKSKELLKNASFVSLACLSLFSATPDMLGAFGKVSETEVLEVNEVPSESVDKPTAPTEEAPKEEAAKDGATPGKEEAQASDASNDKAASDAAPQK